MECYRVPGLNTIRRAQQLLVDDGLVETRQGVGSFVLRPFSGPVDPSTCSGELRTGPPSSDSANNAANLFVPYPKRLLTHPGLMWPRPADR